MDVSRSWRNVPRVVFRIEIVQNGTVEHEKWQHGMAGIQGRMQGPVVVPAQVTAEPMKGDFFLGE